jgi:hypothetical protein
VTHLSSGGLAFPLTTPKKRNKHNPMQHVIGFFDLLAVSEKRYVPDRVRAMREHKGHRTNENDGNSNTGFAIV